MIILRQCVQMKLIKLTWNIMLIVNKIIWGLTLWVLNKMTAIMQTTFSKAFFREKNCISIQIYWIVFLKRHLMK